MKDWKINIIFSFLILIGAVITYRLIYLQIIHHDLYRALAQGQQGAYKSITGQRGQIFFNQGQILATNIKTEGDVLRSYPQGALASRISGFLGGEGMGQYGIEGYYEEILKGQEDVIGLKKETNVDGKDVYLTIDYNIQFIAESLLKKAEEELKSEGGQIIVLDPNSGKIIAMAEFPSFDPNVYYKAESWDIFQNVSVQKLYEPGSTLKPITMASAIDLGKISPGTIYNDTGNVKISGHIIENYGGRSHGERTMTEVLERSINTGAVFVERQMGHRAFWEYLEKFGLFKATGIDLQGESYSENRKLKNGTDIDFATVSFGQGIEITPIQLVRAFSAIANGGKLVKPYVVEKILSEEKTLENKREFSEEVISSSTASKVTAMMVSVIENGFSKSGKIEGYYIAGKTGTAQVPWSALGIDKKGYSDKTWQSFIGFFPAFNPKFLILVKLDNPRANTAEYSALPVFKEMARYIIDYYSIAPDYE